MLPLIFSNAKYIMREQNVSLQCMGRRHDMGKVEKQKKMDMWFMWKTVQQAGRSANQPEYVYHASELPAPANLPRLISLSLASTKWNQSFVLIGVNSIGE